MEEEKRELKISKSEMIATKWLTIIVITYLPILFAITYLIQFFTNANIYEYYYVSFISDLLWGPGISLFLIGLIINELIYFFKCKEYKKVIALIFLLCCICSITYKWIPYSEFYKDYKDLHYVIENNYCEDVQELKSVYVNVTTGKITTKALYVKTSDFEFQVLRNIAEESDYDSFKWKYKDVKKVRIKYLPNSNLLLGIEPVKD